MIVTIDVADLGARSTIRTVRRRAASDRVPGLRWLEVAIAAPLASKRPPRLRRAVMLAMWDDSNAAESFATSHPLASRFAPGLHAELRPLRAFGMWPGLDDEIPRARVTDHDGLVMALTLGRLRLGQTIRFLRASRPAERAATNADGFIWGTAAARPPFVATISVWGSADAIMNYAYTTPDGGHPRAITAQRRKDFHHQSAFVRLAPIRLMGALEGSNPLSAAMLTAPGDQAVRSDDGGSGL